MIFRKGKSCESKRGASGDLAIALRGPRRRPNGLLLVLVGVSVLVHVLLFLKVADLYRTPPRPAIELTLRDILRPPERSIPRPPQAGHAPLLPSEVGPPRQVRVKARVLPESPAVLSPAPSAPAPPAPPPGLPPAEASERLSVAVWRPAPGRPARPRPSVSAPSPKEGTAKDRSGYLEAVRRRILDARQYPLAAVSRGMEGRAVVRFVIDREGAVREVEVAQSSGNRLLDRAALEAVKKAAPFPAPPRGLFQGLPRITLPVVFRLEQGWR